MSFFGFNTELPKEGPGQGATRGIFETPDPFAEVSRARAPNYDDDEAIDFEDTYDGLGDQLDETGDDFNDDTFGGGLESNEGPQRSVGKDFDFFGQTAQVSNAISEEQLRYSLQHPQSKAVPPDTVGTSSKPKKTGYEKYSDPGYIPDIQAKSNVWGTAQQQKLASEDYETPSNRQSYGQDMPTAQPVASATAKKYMSLEEVEAAMRAQSQRPGPSQAAQPPPQRAAPALPQSHLNQLPQTTSHHRVHSKPQQISHSHTPELPQPEEVLQSTPYRRGTQVPQILQRLQPIASHPSAPGSSTQPFQILQNPNRHQPPTMSQNIEPADTVKPASTVGPTQIPIITHPQQLLQLSEEQRRAYLIEDAKRAKRNHKIFLLSKGNGLMTPQDKNFITRIQLQQLVSATGNVNDPDPEAALAEDFYYQVYSQIRGAPRQHPHQPLGHFAQTYLFQTGGRTGGSTGRRQYFNGDNHMQRMQQQVQRAVEAAKLKPKNKQLIIEGSLGKISFSNAKTPKPLLNIKRPESTDGHRPASAKKAHADLSASDRKSILRNIEGVYRTLMRMEDHERRMPPSPEEGDAEAIQKHLEWRQELQLFTRQLWDELKVLEPIVPGSSVLHPFIAFLSYSKGKKAIPRVFRHIDQEQRVTILTIIIVHLDLLDVVRRAQLQPGESQPSLAVREEIELFSQVVMPSLLGYVSEAPMNIITGLLGLVLQQTQVQSVARTKVGLGILTMLLSRAEIIKEAGAVSDRDWQQWADLYNKLFDTLEPVLKDIFPGTINSGDDMYVWQFLAAVGIGASPDQQQRLVVAVKDRVMETVAQSKTLPAEMSSQRLGNVNLFMRAIGLDVELLG